MECRSISVILAKNHHLQRKPQFTNALGLPTFPKAKNSQIAKRVLIFCLLMFLGWMLTRAVEAISAANDLASFLKSNRKFSKAGDI